LPGARTFSGGVQKIPEFEINDRIVLQPHIWYTCPAGKKAVVTGRVQCTGLGAAANASFVFAGVVMFRWLVTALSHDYLTAPRELSVGDSQFAEFSEELSAGDTIETIQSTGTNSEFNVWAKVQETPI